MRIFDTKSIDMTFTKGQEDAIKAFHEFIQGDTDIFIMKGYAGTGKTTIVKEFLNIAAKLDRTCALIAPTGRASLILSNKTGHDTSTIHRHIYELDMVMCDQGDEDDESELTYFFPLKKDSSDHLGRITIVDEASMISSKYTKNELLRFGSGILLEDLLKYGNAGDGGKIVFVGDPAQLPPVGDSDSLALSREYMESRNLKVYETELTEVVRQDGDSVILTNATKVRDLLKQDQRNSLGLTRKEDEFEDIDESEIITRYLSSAPTPSFESPVIICWANKYAYDYNTYIRRRMYGPEAETVQPGDRIIIISNNYSNPIRDIYNGEFAMVLDAAPVTTTLTAPVYVQEGKECVKKDISLTYRDVTLKMSDGKIIQTVITDSLLMSDKKALTYEETCSAYINFKMRHPELKEHTYDFRMTIKADPYINAIRAKFGYAITGHKSQGGEWSTVFADFSGRTGTSDDALRWTYTVITRARECLFAANTPELTPYAKLKVNPMQIDTTPAEKCCSYSQVPCTPFHNEGTNAAIRAQFISISSELEKAGYRITHASSFPYLERYMVSTPEGTLYTFDCRYNKSGRFSRCTCQQATPESAKIAALIDDAGPMFIKIEYTPSSQPLKHLYHSIVGFCEEEGITVTNIEEYISSYKVIYHLRTSGRFSSLTIYVDKNGMFTRICPTSDIAEDAKLMKLIEFIETL